MAVGGFPGKVRYTPVPSPLFGPLLEQIDDLAELKCTLRLIWLLHQKKGSPRYVTLEEVLADRVLVSSVPHEDNDRRREIQRALASAVARGTFVTGSMVHGDPGAQLYMLNTEADRRALAEVLGDEPQTTEIPGVEPWEGAAERPNIFGLYEDNIGMLSPIIAEELKEAETSYPESWIEDAFREAVSLNKRNWRYISAILERWTREGRSDGEPGRYPKKAGYQEYFRR